MNQDQMQITGNIGNADHQKLLDEIQSIIEDVEYMYCFKFTNNHLDAYFMSPDNSFCQTQLKTIKDNIKLNQIKMNVIFVNREAKLIKKKKFEDKDVDATRKLKTI